MRDIDKILDSLKANYERHTGLTLDPDMLKAMIGELIETKCRDFLHGSIEQLTVPELITMSVKCQKKRGKKITR